MGTTTYSFSDIQAVITHPSFSSMSIYNEGVGDMTFNKTNVNTVHDLAADGSVMVSKIVAKNGSVIINAQQTSNLHRYFNDLFNYLESAPTDEWSQIQLDLRAPKLHEQKICVGGSFQKQGDTPYQQQGQRVSWTLMFAQISNQRI